MKTIWRYGLVLAVALAGASASYAQDKPELVFVVNGASDFWKIAEAGVRKAQAELPNYDLQFKYPEQAAAAIQQRLMDDLVAAGADAIMVSAVDPKTSTEALNRDRQPGPAVHDRQRRPAIQPHRLYRQLERRRSARMPAN